MPTHFASISERRAESVFDSRRIVQDIKHVLAESRAVDNERPTPHTSFNPNRSDPTHPGLNLTLFRDEAGN